MVNLSDWQMAMERLLQDNVSAIERSNEASTKLTTRIYWLTWVLVILTVVMTVFTLLLWLRL